MSDIIAQSNGWCVLDPLGNIVPNSLTQKRIRAAWTNTLWNLDRKLDVDTVDTRIQDLKDSGYVCVVCQVLVREGQEAADAEHQ